MKVFLKIIEKFEMIFIEHKEIIYLLHIFKNAKFKKGWNSPKN